MAFRVYSGPRGAHIFAPIDKDKMPFRQCGALDEAIAWARQVSREGRTVWLIEGDDGTHLTRPQIAAALRQGDTAHAEQGTGRPLIGATSGA